MGWVRTNVHFFPYLPELEGAENMSGLVKHTWTLPLIIYDCYLSLVLLLLLLVDR